MGERKPLSKSVRFEIFKRDAFTCQYCGKKAPDVVLHVDHIKPVSKGGLNELINLVTSCEACNLGKGAKELSDSSAINRQRYQLEQLQIRREQLDMLLQWHSGLSDIRDREVDAFIAKIEHIAGVTVERKWASRTVKKFGLIAALEATDTAEEKYFNSSDQNSIETFLSMIPRIAGVSELTKKKPYMHDLFRIRKAIKFRFRYTPNDYEILDFLEHMHVDFKVSIDRLDSIARRCTRWTDYLDLVQEEGIL